MDSIVLVSDFTGSNSSLNSCRIFSISEDRDAMVCVVFTRLFRSSALSLACSEDSVVNATICSIIFATCVTCMLISDVISTEEFVVSCKLSLFCVKASILFATAFAPCVFSTASSRTTVIPSIIELLAVLTCSTVVITRCRSFLILSVMAPSDSFKWRIDMT